MNIIRENVYKNFYNHFNVYTTLKNLSTYKKIISLAVFIFTGILAFNAAKLLIRIRSNNKKPISEQEIDKTRSRIFSQKEQQVPKSKDFHQPNHKNNFDSSISTKTGQDNEITKPALIKENDSQFIDNSKLIENKSLSSTDLPSEKTTLNIEPHLINENDSAVLEPIEKNIEISSPPINSSPHNDDHKKKIDLQILDSVQSENNSSSPLTDLALAKTDVNTQTQSIITSDSELQHLFDLGKTIANFPGKSAITSYVNCLHSIIQNPNSRTTLFENDLFRQTLFTHITSCYHALIFDENKKDSLEHLEELFFKYSSNNELSLFLKTNILNLSCENSSLSFIFLNILDESKINRLLELKIDDLLFPFIDYAWSLNNHVKDEEKRNLFIFKFYQKFPQSPWWQKIKAMSWNASLFSNSNLLNLKPSVTAIEIHELLLGPISRDDLTKNIKIIFSLIPNEYRNHGKVFKFLVPYLFSHSEDRIKDMIYAFAKNFTHCFSTVDIQKFLNEIFASKNIKILKLIISEYIKIGHSIYGFHHDLEYLLGRIHSLDLLSSCMKSSLSLPEPYKTFVLRFWINGRFEDGFRKRSDNNYIRYLQKICTDLQLDQTKYPPLKKDIFENVYLMNPFLDLISLIKTREQLEKAVEEYSKQAPLLRSLAAGIDVGNGVLLNINMEEKVIKEVFEKNSLNFDDYNKMIPIDELLNLDDKLSKRYKSLFQQRKIDKILN